MEYLIYIFAGIMYGAAFGVMTLNGEAQRKVFKVYTIGTIIFIICSVVVLNL